MPGSIVSPEQGAGGPRRFSSFQLEASPAPAAICASSWASLAKAMLSSHASRHSVPVEQAPVPQGSNAPYVCMASAFASCKSPSAHTLVTAADGTVEITELPHKEPHNGYLQPSEALSESPTRTAAAPGE